MASPRPPPPEPLPPHWSERWRNGLRAAETAVVIGLWGSGLAASDLLIAAIFLVAGAGVGVWAVCFDASRSKTAKAIASLAVVLFFTVTLGVVYWRHQSAPASGADRAGATPASKPELPAVQSAPPPDAAPAQAERRPTSPETASPADPSRIVIDGIDIRINPKGNGLITSVGTRNAGKGPGYVPFVISSIHTGPDVLTEEEISRRMEEVVSTARHTRPSTAETIEAGDRATTQILQDIPANDWQAVKDRRDLGYVWIALAFRDQTTRADQVWVSRYAGVYERDGSVRNLARRTDLMTLLSPPVGATKRPSP